MLWFAVVGVIGVYFTIFWSSWATSFASDRGWSAKPAAYDDPLGALLIALPLTLVTMAATAFGADEPGARLATAGGVQQ